MMNAVKTLTIMGAQSHANTKLHFKRYGVHRISAEGSSNSHGKSVIMKMIYALNGEFLDRESRSAIIRDDSEYAIASLESYNGYRLSVVIHEEKSKCFYMLEYKGQAVKKTLSDDYKELIKVLNFHKTEEFDYSLNVYKTKTTLPFTHFSGTQNEKILVSASEIPNYRKMLDSLTENIKVIEQDMALNKTRIASCESNLNLIRYNYTQEDIDEFKLYDRFVTDYQTYQKVHTQLEDLVVLKYQIEEHSKKTVINPSLTDSILTYARKINECSKLLSNAILDKEQAKNEKAKSDKIRFVDKEIAIVSKLNESFKYLKEVVDSRHFLETSEKFNPSINLDIIENLKAVQNHLKDIVEGRLNLIKIKVSKPMVETEYLRQLNDLHNSINTFLQVKNDEPKPVKKVVRLDLKPLTVLKDIHSHLNWLNAGIVETHKSRVSEPKCDINLLLKLKSLGDSAVKLMELSYSIKSNKEIMLKTKSEISSLIDELGLCPTCGSELDAERIFEHEHI